MVDTSRFVYFKKHRFLGHSSAYDEIGNIQENNQQRDTTEDTRDRDGYLRPVASNRNYVVPNTYEEIKEPYEELKHQHLAVRHGVIDQIPNKSWHQLSSIYLFQSSCSH